MVDRGVHDLHHCDCVCLLPPRGRKQRPLLAPQGRRDIRGNRGDPEAGRLLLHDGGRALDKPRVAHRPRLLPLPHDGRLLGALAPLGALGPRPGGGRLLRDHEACGLVGGGAAPHLHRLLHRGGEVWAPACRALRLHLFLRDPRSPHELHRAKNPVARARDPRALGKCAPQRHHGPAHRCDMSAGCPQGARSQGETIEEIDPRGRSIGSIRFPSGRWVNPSCSPR